jgi:hypothetical protein
MTGMGFFERVERRREGRAAMMLTVMATAMLDIGPWLTRHHGRHGDRHPGQSIIAWDTAPSLSEDPAASPIAARYRAPTLVPRRFWKTLVAPRV